MKAGLRALGLSSLLTSLLLNSPSALNQPAQAVVPADTYEFTLRLGEAKAAPQQDRLLELLQTQPDHLLRPWWVYLLARNKVSAQRVASALKSNDPLWPHYWWWLAMQSPSNSCSHGFGEYARKASLSQVLPQVPESTDIQARLHCVEGLKEPERLRIAEVLDQHRYFWLLPRVLKGASSPEALWLQGQTQMLQGQYKSALNSFETLVKQQRTPGELKKKAVIEAGLAARRLRAYASAQKWWSWISPSDSSFYPEVLWQQGQLAFDSNQQAQGKATFSRLIQQFPTHPRVPDALEALLSAAVLSQNHAETQKWAQQWVNGWPDHPSTPMARYWLGRSYELRGQQNNARQWYQQQSQGALNNYYTQLSLCKLARQDCFKPVRTPLKAETPQLWFLKQYPVLQKLVDNHQSRILEVIAPFAPLSALEQDLLKSYALRVNGHYFRSIRTIWTQQTRNPAFLQLMYPLHYDSLQKENAQRYGLPQSLIAGLTWQESMYKADIRSPSGALGLMQLMPATAREIAPRAGLPGLSTSQLTDPKVNIRLGAYYLAQNLKHWNGDLLPTIASYNAGPNAVARWKQSFGQLPADLFVEKIPYDETRRYVKQVLTHSRVYEAVYGSP